MKTCIILLTISETQYVYKLYISCRSEEDRKKCYHDLKKGIFPGNLQCHFKPQYFGKSDLEYSNVVLGKKNMRQKRKLSFQGQ